MNRSRVIWGIVFLVLAMGLGVLNLTLPADKLMFAVGDDNLIWIPVAALGILGIAFLTAAASGKRRA